MHRDPHLHRPPPGLHGVAVVGLARGADRSRVLPESVVPESVVPESVVPESVVPESVVPESVVRSRLPAAAGACTEVPAASVVPEPAVDVW